jgi:hypothetical protein
MLMTNWLVHPGWPAVCCVVIVWDGVSGCCQAVDAAAMASH